MMEDYADGTKLHIMRFRFLLSFFQNIKYLLTKFLIDDALIKSSIDDALTQSTIDDALRIRSKFPSGIQTFQLLHVNRITWDCNRSHVIKNCRYQCKTHILNLHTSVRESTSLTNFFSSRETGATRQLNIKTLIQCLVFACNNPELSIQQTPEKNAAELRG